jgi:hypothetical protein
VSISNFCCLGASTRFHIFTVGVRNLHFFCHSFC